MWNLVHIHVHTAVGSLCMCASVSFFFLFSMVYTKSCYAANDEKRPVYFKVCAETDVGIIAMCSCASGVWFTLA